MEAFRHAGCTVLAAPTDGADIRQLAPYGLENEMQAINHKLMTCIGQMCGTLPAAGCLGGGLPVSALANLDEEETQQVFSFSERIAQYRAQAAVLQEAGAALIILRQMADLAECRAAFFACRRLHLPVIVCVEAVPEGNTVGGSNLLSVLVSMQAMGICGFGVSCPEHMEALPRLVQELAPFARVPLIGSIVLGPEEACGIEDASRLAHALLEAGASGIEAGNGLTAAHIHAICESVRRFDFEKRILPADDSGIVLANERQIFRMEHDWIELSEPVSCSLDMADQLLAAEEEGRTDVVTIQIDSADDAALFAENAHMLNLPVAFLSDQEAALRSALLRYHGRAIIDSRSSIEEDTLREIAKKYGAVIY